MRIHRAREAYFALWSEKERAWAAKVFASEAWIKLRQRFFELEALLESEPRARVARRWWARSSGCAGNTPPTFGSRSKAA